MAETTSQRDILEARKKKNQKPQEQSQSQPFQQRNGLAVGPGGRPPQAGGPDNLDKALSAGKMGADVGKRLEGMLPGNKPAQSNAGGFGDAQALNGFGSLGDVSNGVTPSYATMEGFGAEGLDPGGDMPMIGQSAGELGDIAGGATGDATGGGMGVGGGVSGALQGAGSAFGLAQAAKSGDIMGILKSLYGLGDAASSLSGGGSLASMLGNLSGMSQGMSAGLGSAVGAAAPIIQGIMDYMSVQAEQKARESGYANNPIAGGMYSNATAGVERAKQAVAKLLNGGDLSTVDLNDLKSAIPYVANNLQPYFATTQGPAGAIKASDASVGQFGRTGIGNTEEYTRNENEQQANLFNMVKEALNRGVSYEEMGKMPVSGDIAQQSMDMMDPGQAMYDLNAGKYNAEGEQLLQNLRNQLITKESTPGQTISFLPWANQMEDGHGAWVDPSKLTTENLFKSAMGASQLAPDKETKASGLYTGMYGGPLWAELARMGGARGDMGPEIQSAIQSHFDPWFYARTESPSQLAETLHLGDGTFKSIPNESAAAANAQGPVGGESTLQSSLPGGAEGGMGVSGEAGKAIGRLQPRNVVTGLQALPRPESDARSEAAFGMRRPLTSGNPSSQDQNQAMTPPVPGTSGAESKPFGMQHGGFAVAPGGNIGTGGLVTQAPFGSRPAQGSRGGM